MLSFKNNEIEALRIARGRHAARKIKHAIEYVLRYRARLECSNHASLYNNVGELHHADQRIT